MRVCACVHVCVCVRACVRVLHIHACISACVCVCVFMCVCVCMCVYVYVCMRVCVCCACMRAYVHVCNLMPRLFLTVIEELSLDMYYAARSTSPLSVLFTCLHIIFSHNTYTHPATHSEWFSKSKSAKSKGKSKTRKKVAAMVSSQEDPDTVCSVCKKEFPSRNKLFQHIKETGHAVHISVSGTEARASRTSDHTRRKGKRRK